MESTFGFRFSKQKSELEKHKTPTFTAPTNMDGSVVFDSDILSPVFSALYDTKSVFGTEIELINKYREMSIYSEIESAIDEIVNEMVVVDTKQPSAAIVFGEDFKFSEELQNRIQQEFRAVLRLLNFNRQAYEIVKRWYIDGKIYYQLVIDNENPRKGILELRNIDPRQIKKIREVIKTRDPNLNVDVVKEIKEYFIYDPTGQSGTEHTMSIVNGIRITTDQIAFANSGNLNQDGSVVLSYLHKAMKAYNNLKIMEDSMVVYRIVRAPERRVFNIDTMDLPPVKAYQYVQNIMTQYKNKLVYDASTGEVRDDRRYMTMLEDYWFPKRSDGRGSEVTTLPGGQSLSELADVEYFQKKLYRSLHIPITRLEPTTGFNLGKASEITQQEEKFASFITRLRYQFSHLFDQLLRAQLILKGITTPDDWEYIKENLYYDFLSDSHFSELLKAELLKSRLDVLDQAQQYVGTYFSKEFVKRFILMQTDSEIEEIEQEIKKEAAQESGESIEEPSIEATPTQEVSPEEEVPAETEPPEEENPPSEQPETPEQF